MICALLIGHVDYEWQVPLVEYWFQAHRYARSEGAP